MRTGSPPVQDWTEGRSDGGAARRSVASSEVLELLAGRWPTQILFLLADRPHRFNELQRRLDGIAAKVLTSTLHRLEERGVVACRRGRGRSHYELAEFGAALLEPLAELLACSARYRRE